MRWLTDQPESTAGFLPPPLVWRSGADLPDEQDRALAPWLASGRDWWMADGEVDARFPQRRIAVIDHAATSQFSALGDALKAGVSLPDGLVAIALTGERFHGQRQRPWTALRGNLHLTAHYLMKGSAARLQAGLAMAPAVAATEAILALSGGHLKPAIKWTNDVLLAGKKVAGVLTSTVVESRQVQQVLFGMGVNVEQVPDFPLPPWVPPPGALVESDPSLCGALPRVLSAVVRAMDDAVAQLRGGDTDSLFERYRSRAAFLGRNVVIWPDGKDPDSGVSPLAHGRVEELRPDLSLRISGCAEPVASGRMVLHEPGGWDFPYRGKP